MTTTAAAQTAQPDGDGWPVTRTVTTDGGNVYAIAVDPPAATVIGSYRDNEERREVAVDPVGDGAWTVTDRATGPNREAVEVETVARFVEDPLGEAVALAADYLQVAGRDPQPAGPVSGRSERQRAPLAGARSARLTTLVNRPPRDQRPVERSRPCPHDRHPKHLPDS